MIPASTSASLPASAGLVNPWLHLYVCRHMAQADRKQKRPRVMALNQAIETLVFWLQNLGLSGLLYGLQLVPYRWRVPAAGWVVTRLVAPLAGYRTRIRENLALAWPELAHSRIETLVRDVPDNAGRTLIEIYSGASFKAQVAQSPIRGAGWQTLIEARARGQGVILVSGHFGNYDVPRAVLSAKGYPVGGLYKPARNPFFNKHYIRKIEAIGAPIFPRGRRGLADMVKHLKSGGMMGMLIDQHITSGPLLHFFGQPAHTALSAAELALKYDLLLIPAYGVRGADGLTFEVVVDPPIPRSTPEEMTQALNDNLEAQIRQHPAQWFWIHRRWKP